MRIVFLHGLESGPYGSKYRALAAKFPHHVSAPDCGGVLGMEERLQIILNHLGEAPALLVGSSFGGLAAALVHQRRPDLVLGVVLCAPAFQRPEAVELTGLGEIPAVIIHGTGDTVVPLEASQKFASSHSVRLIEVEGGHRLHSAIDLIVEMVGEVQSCIKQA